MSVRRALVSCAVLSLQDSCVFYPSCRWCFSRINLEQQDAARCSKCGYSCQMQQVDYRYRLSLRVVRDKCIFGVTVFGTCLNPFFGIPASGLQRLVDNLDGPVGASTRSTLLVKAVEDCFIGRHFIFGIKVTGSDNGLWSGGPVGNGSTSKETAQFIASQMILPKAAGLEGCTVVNYYRILLQKAEEFEIGSTDANKTSRLPAPTLLLIHHNSPAGSFNCSSLSARSLLSQTQQRSQDQDCNLTPTPPWQQSLGLVTSSAEQEEDCSNHYEGDESSTHPDNNSRRSHTLRDCLEKHELTDETKLPPLPFISLSLDKYLNTVLNTPILNSWFSPPHSVNTKDLPLSSKAKEFSNTQLTKSFLSSSLAWDDLPFSESLTAFMGDKDEGYDNCTINPHLNWQKTARSNLKIRSQDGNLSTTNEIAPRQSRLLVDITNTPPLNDGGDGHELCNKVCRSICSNKCNQDDGEASVLFCEDKYGDTYNCSADLFSSSLMIDVNTVLPSEIARMNSEVCALLCSPDKLMCEKICVPHSTSDSQELNRGKCINKDGAIALDTQDLDFVPSSQSTPNVKLAVVSKSASYSSTLSEFASKLGSHDLCAFCGNLPKLDSKKPQKNVCRCMTSSKCSQIFTPKRKFWQPKKHHQYLLAQQPQNVNRGALNLDSTARIHYKCDSCICHVTACDFEDNEVPPTPAVEARLSVKLGRRWQTDSSSDSDPTCHGVNCKRSLLHQTLTWSQKSVAQTENCDSEFVGEGSLIGLVSYLLDDENQACDWSRDLFSDSV